MIFFFFFGTSIWLIIYTFPGISDFCNVVSKIHIYTKEVEKMTIGMMTDDTQSCLDQAPVIMEASKSSSVGQPDSSSTVIRVWSMALCLYACEQVIKPEPSWMFVFAWVCISNTIPLTTLHNSCKCMCGDINNQVSVLCFRWSTISVTIG